MANVDVGMHRITEIKACGVDGYSWLKIRNDTGSEIALFVTAHEAEALESAWDSTRVTVAAPSDALVDAMYGNFDAGAV